MFKTINKFFLDFDREERWLNEMSAEGWALKGYKSGTYFFESSIPNLYKYKIELFNITSQNEKELYLSFLEDMGITVIATYAGRVYLGKESSDNDFVVYNDLDSRIKHYQKNYAILTGIFSSYLVLSILFFVIAMQNFTARGASFYIPFVFACLLFGFGMVFYILGKPHRKRIRRLKMESKIRE